MSAVVISHHLSFVTEKLTGVWKGFNHSVFFFFTAFGIQYEGLFHTDPVVVVVVVAATAIVTFPLFSVDFPAPPILSSSTVGLAWVIIYFGMADWC